MLETSGADCGKSSSESERERETERELGKSQARDVYRVSTMLELGTRQLTIDSFVFVFAACMIYDVENPVR